MASIQKRPSRQGPRYRVQVRRRGRAQSATFPSLAQARRWAARTEHALYEQHHFPTAEAARRTLGELLERYAVRVLAARLPPEAAALARHRKYQQAQKHSRTPSAATLTLADWVLVVTTLAPDWTLADVLRLYRARWQVELVLKRMKQLLRFNQLRSTHRTTVETTVRALLVAWALQDGIVAEVRALLSTPMQAVLPVVSTWLLVGLGLETLRQQVQHTWSLARLRTCLPRLRRFLCSRPRRREHQEAAVRAWLEGRSPGQPLIEVNAA